MRIQFSSLGSNVSVRPEFRVDFSSRLPDSTYRGHVASPPSLLRRSGGATGRPSSSTPIDPVLSKLRRPLTCFFLHGNHPVSPGRPRFARFARRALQPNPSHHPGQPLHITSFSIFPPNERSTQAPTHEPLASTHELRHSHGLSPSPAPALGPDDSRV